MDFITGNQYNTNHFLPSSSSQPRWMFMAGGRCSFSFCVDFSCSGDFFVHLSFRVKISIITQVKNSLSFLASNLHLSCLSLSVFLPSDGSIFHCQQISLVRPFNIIWNLIQSCSNLHHWKGNKKTKRKCNLKNSILNRFFYTDF